MTEKGGLFPSDEGSSFVLRRRVVTAPSIIHSASATLSSIVVKLGQKKRDATAFLAHQRCIVLE